MKWTLQAAKDEPMEEVFGLYEKRVEWMKQRGLRQWDAGYLAAYPLSYYQMQRDAGRLYLLKDAEGRLAGAAVLLSRDGRWPDGDRASACYVHNLVTDPDKRGRSGSCCVRRRHWPAPGGLRGCAWIAGRAARFSTIIMRKWDISPPANARRRNIEAFAGKNGCKKPEKAKLPPAKNRIDYGRSSTLTLSVDWATA